MIARFALFLILACAAFARQADADGFQPRRSLALDLWITWPTEEKWHDEAVMLPFPEWRRQIDAAGLARLKQAGFDTLRLPIDPAPFLSAATRPFRDRLYAGIAEAVDDVRAAGLKVIVDMHAITSGPDRPIGTGEILKRADLFDTYVRHLARMAGLLADAPADAVALELLNEPVTGCEGADQRRWNRQARRLHEAARAAAPRLTLILSGACWGSAEGLAAMDPGQFADDNLVWSFHSYDPFLLTHQGAEWAGDTIRHVTGLPFPPHKAGPDGLARILDGIRERIHAEAPLLRQPGMIAWIEEELARMDTAPEIEAVLDAPFTAVATWAATHAIPADRIILGEFGMIRQEWKNPFVMPAEERAAYYAAMIARAEKAGHAWSMWSYSGAFGVVEAFDRHPAEPDVLNTLQTRP